MNDRSTAESLGIVAVAAKLNLQNHLVLSADSLKTTVREKLETMLCEERFSKMMHWCGARRDIVLNFLEALGEHG